MLLKAVLVLQASTLLAVGDWACNDNTQNTVKNILTKKPELVLALGDLSYQKSPDCWFEIVSPLDNVTRIVRGDHDSDARMTQYMQHFKMSKEFYSFNHKNIHFLIMSTETPYEMNSEQYQFVKSDLENVSSAIGYTMDHRCLPSTRIYFSN